MTSPPIRSRGGFARRALLAVVAAGAVGIVAAWTSVTAAAASTAGHGGAHVPWIALIGVVCVCVGLFVGSDALALPVGCGAILVAAARTPDVARPALLEGPIGLIWAISLVVAVALVVMAAERRDHVVAPRSRPIVAEPSLGPAAMHAWRGAAGVLLLVGPVTVAITRRGVSHEQPDVAGLVFALLLLVFSGLIGFYSSMVSPALNARWDALQLDREARANGRSAAVVRLVVAAVVVGVAAALLL